MKTIMITGALALVVCLAVSARQTVAAPQEPVPVDASSLAAGLSDLNAMTFSCPKAGLNAAARQAAKAPSQGTYQFSYFKIVSDTHHAAYEVYFKSNYEGEPELRYCVEMYCQQGFDPKTTKTTVTLMSTQVAGARMHGGTCGGHQPTSSRRMK
jgi:hypothetical protein